MQPVQPQGNQDVAVDHQALPANQEEVAAVAANGNEEGAEPAAAEVNPAGGGENAGQGKPSSMLQSNKFLMH